MSQAEEPGSVTLPLVWLGPEDVPILYCNAFVSQFDPQTMDSIIVTVGQLTPPAISGATNDEREEQLRSVSFVPIKPVVRLGLTLARARELAATLQANLDQLERATTVRGGDPRQ